MTEQEFNKKYGVQLNIKLLLHYRMYTAPEEQETQLDTDVIFFEFPEGQYSITFGDLKERALVEEELAKVPKQFFFN